MNSKYDKMELELIQRQLTMNELFRDMDTCIQMLPKSPPLQKIIRAYIIEALSLCTPTKGEYDNILKAIDFDMVPVEENPHWVGVD